MSPSTPITYLKDPRIEGAALVGTTLDGERARLPLPARRLHPEIPLSAVAEAVEAAVAEAGDRELWTTAPSSYDWNFTLWVGTIECEIIPGKPQTWRRLVVRAWGSLENQQQRYWSGPHAAQLEDPRELVARIRAERAQREQQAREQAARDAAEQADAEALAAMPLGDLEREWQRRVDADQESALLARRVLSRRSAEVAEEGRRERTSELLARLAPGTRRRLKENLWEVSGTGYRSEGQDPMTVMLAGFRNQTPGSWPLEWWVRVLEHGQEGVFPPHRIRLKLQEVGVEPLRAQRIEVEGRAVWAGRASYAGCCKAVWEDTGYLVRGKIVEKLAERL